MRRTALIIGIDNYPHYPLKNAVADACRVDSVLNERGFETCLHTDADHATLEASLKEFKKKADKADIALIYLAGHGIERSGSGYFLPRDFHFL